MREASAVAVELSPPYPYRIAKSLSGTSLPLRDLAIRQIRKVLPVPCNAKLPGKPFTERVYIPAALLALTYLCYHYNKPPTPQR
ncbi:jg12105 [Pararge aegeria aegeria]|uniref:Jg12105 protein n=1 Tax=Pararge aegeria aegeria TaxID=348720 RepID=A0A8S4SBS6_9NEOP|nr:jg12105 [Pararge aegeria aegeria]